jgi:hypothetical protein
LIVADDEAIAGAGTGPVSPLVSMLGIPDSAEIDVLTDDNAAHYWERSDRFDMALDLSAGGRGIAALGVVIESWIRHMLSRGVSVEPLSALREVPLTWYVGLDAEGTRIGDALWRGDGIGEATQRRLVALFRLTLPDGADPVYLILAMTSEKMLRMKPQNLLTGLPGRPAAAGK